jgi:DNA replication protein DnaC
MNTIIKNKPDRCDTHGDFESRNVYKNVWTKCPQCAAEQQAVEQREKEERAAVARFLAWQKQLGEVGIPERFSNRTLGSYVAENEGQCRVLAFAQEYAEHFDTVQKTGRSAIFCGQPGTGKTHLAAGIGLRLMEMNKLVLFTTAQRALRRIKDSWRKDSKESESDVVRLLVQPDLLILDEIGVQYGTKFEENAIFDILNERYEKRRPCLLLSNQTLQEVRTFIGERVYDRLREDDGKCVPFDWASHRGSAA